MLRFREHNWLLAPGTTCFQAWIQPAHRTHEDITWSLVIRYVAGGARWRRVKSWERPSLLIEIHGIRPKKRRWCDLENINFWEPADEDNFDSGIFSAYYKAGPGVAQQRTALEDPVWRVIERDGRFLTVELAVLADGRNSVSDLPESAIPGARETSLEDADADFWKANAQLYLIERIPFGIVNVRIPRNVHDHETYAISRARSILGLDRPEYFEIHDFAGGRHDELLRDELHADLHFHGYYED